MALSLTQITVAAASSVSQPQFKVYMDTYVKRTHLDHVQQPTITAIHLATTLLHLHYIQSIVLVTCTLPVRSMKQTHSCIKQLYCIGSVIFYPNM